MIDGAIRCLRLTNFHPFEVRESVADLSGKIAAPGYIATTDYAFEMICSTIRFGKGVTAEIGYDIKNLGLAHTLVVTDKNVINTTAFK
ncbi:hypothetical protein KIN20_015892 [Parelaphostrongylus tenuis]|uniref:Uncharacterized protein n=1 Tax=Parelaphostrongylus tenuis TaxID=148309 RepID=A0AAD5MJ71_PARTN|nr:hypothetical protein KIN20_015892 [Parelaphostrongylus tenuis]